MSLVETLDAAPANTDGRTIDPEGRAEALELTAPSRLPEARLFEVVKGWFQADKQQSSSWRTLVTEWMGFRAGDQWSSEDQAKLDEQERPHIVFNRVLTILKAVAGMEINGRHETSFLPRGIEDTAANETLSAASKWMGDNCDGEDEESAAFETASTVGLGFTEHRMDYEEDPSGKYIEEEIDPREMYWDRTSRKKNLSDARRMHRLRLMPLGDAMAMFPDKSRIELDASWAADHGPEAATRSIEERRKRTSEVEAPYDDKCEVTIGETQWYERESYWLVADVENNTKSELSEAQYRTLKQRWPVIQEIKVAAGVMPDPPLAKISVRMTRRVYKSVFWGSELLGAPRPAPAGNRFSWTAITGEWDGKKKQWFGLVRTMHDAQMWANKWLSQIMHILNSTAKGGILAELDAFEDIEEAEESYAKQDSITILANGALSGNKPKIMEKPGAGRVGDYVGLLDFATKAVPAVVGLNPELLGQVDLTQPGVVEAMRKQAGMTVLATMFDALRRFRKQGGRVRLYFIQNYLSDGRLIRITGPDGAKSIPLLRDKTMGEYDVVVDDTPTSPNQKDANWAIIQPLMVAFKEQLMADPELFISLLEYSPVPSRVVGILKEAQQKRANDPQAKQEEEQNKALVLRLGTAKAMRDEAGAAQAQTAAMLNIARAGETEGNMAYNKAMAENLLHDNNFAAAKMYLEALEAGARTEKTSAEAERIRREAGKVEEPSLVDLIDANTRRKAAETARAKAPSEIAKNMATATREHSTAHRERVGAVVDARTPIAQSGQ